MVNQKLKNLTLLFFLTFLMCFSIFSVNISAQVPKTSGSAPMQNIVVDGIINEAEWTDGDWKVEFYPQISEVR